MGIIFDLDQTMINSLAVEKLRKQRAWAEVYKMIPALLPYEGISEVLNIISEKNIPYGIVTSSPSSYCNKIIKHWQWDIPTVVCYHDTKKHKPFPDPILLAVEKMGIDKEKILSIGDDPRDIQASKRAGVKSAGALWGVINKKSLIEENADYYFDTVEDLKIYIINNY